MAPRHPLLDPLRRLHRQIRDAVVASTERAAGDSLARVAADDEGDTIYAIDRVAEHALVDAIERDIARQAPVVLVAEGLPGGRVVLPRGAAARAAAWVIVVDPIDGTRGLMYQKRPGWILTGAARVNGDAARLTLADIELALQTEIPLVKQHLSDELWAVRGGGIGALRWNRLTNETAPLPVVPSRAKSIGHGFSTIARFFPGVRETLAALDDEIAAAVLGPPVPGKAQLFEDQYISTGGQLYELMAGHDRFIADLRPLFVGEGRLAAGLCCHPYDLCAELIAREAGVVITDERGGPLRAPLDVDSDVAWAGYANADVRAVVEPALQAALRRRGVMR